jgi:hypothetical protein
MNEMIWFACFFSTEATQTMVKEAIRLNCRGALGVAGRILAVDWAKHDGATVKTISERLNVSRSTIQRALAQATPKHKKKAKKKATVTAKQAAIKERRAQVMRLVGQERRVVGYRGVSGRAQPINLRRKVFPSCASISRAIKIANTTRRHPVPVSASTVRRDLKRINFVARVKPKGPRRKDGDERQRLAFVRAHKDLDAHTILWSDKKMLDTNDGGAQGRYEWIPRGEQAQHMERDDYAPSVHVWGCIGYNFRKLIFLPKGGIDAATYIKHVLIPSLSAIKRFPLFQQDGAKAHQAESTKGWLSTKRIATLNGWPPRSPDLSCIETMWARVSRAVADRGPASGEELRQFFQAEWDEIPTEEVNRLVCGWRSRCERCIEVGGRTIVARKNVAKM